MIHYLQFAIVVADVQVNGDGRRGFTEVARIIQQLIHQLFNVNVGSVQLDALLIGIKNQRVALVGFLLIGDVSAEHLAEIK